MGRVADLDMARLLGWTDIDSGYLGLWYGTPLNPVIQKPSNIPLKEHVPCWSTESGAIPDLIERAASIVNSPFHIRFLNNEWQAHFKGMTPVKSGSIITSVFLAVKDALEAR